MARELLIMNTSNRPVRNSAVIELSNAIKRGEWVLTHQGICIDTNNVFIDGQHRLLAIIMSGITVDILLTTGSNPDAFKVIDSTISRSLSDKTKLEKFDAENMALLCRTFLNQGKVTADQALRVYEKTKEQSELIKKIFMKTKTFGSVGFRTAAIMQLLGNEENSEYILDLYKKLLHADIDNLPQVGLSAIKHELKNKFNASAAGGGAVQLGIFTKAFYILDNKNKNVKRLLFEGKQDEIIKSARDIFNKKILYV